MAHDSSLSPSSSVPSGAKKNERKEPPSRKVVASRSFATVAAWMDARRQGSKPHLTLSRRAIDKERRFIGASTLRPASGGGEASAGLGPRRTRCGVGKAKSLDANEAIFFVALHSTTLSLNQMAATYSLRAQHPSSCDRENECHRDRERHVPPRRRRPLLRLLLCRLRPLYARRLHNARGRRH